MANFETVVRPVVFPNIRPAPPRVLPPEADDPTKGFATIRGNGGKHIDLTQSTTISMSKSRGTESERRVDVMRVYQEEEDGTVNKSNFVDVENATKITVRESVDYKRTWYQRQEEKDNVELKEKDKIIKAKE
jgi:hypothetical protein